MSRKFSKNYRLRSAWVELGSRKLGVLRRRITPEEALTAAKGRVRSERSLLQNRLRSAEGVKRLPFGNYLVRNSAMDQISKGPPVYMIQKHRPTTT
jgi:hypothetical protein